MAEKPYRVYPPHGVPWASRFLDVNAAWGRIMSTQHMADSAYNRAWLMREGWQVRETDTADVDHD
jgi:hypothetical protein